MRSRLRRANESGVAEKGSQVSQNIVRLGE